MAKVAFVFSGQGAQKAGMGRSLWESSRGARRLFDMAEARRPGTKRQCFEGTAEELRRTDNTQPCLYLTDLAAATAMREQGVEPETVAGFSLGEIPALAFAGAFSHEDGFEIASLRGRAMQKAAEENPAAMVAVLKLSDEAVAQVCDEVEGAWPVNFNAPGQVVVSCVERSLAQLIERFKARAARLMPLAVSGGFHCPLMASAERELAAAMSAFKIAAPKLPVYADCTAELYEGDPAPLLRRQIVSPVRWSAIVRNMADRGIDTFVEVGVGSTLKNLISRTVSGARVYAVSTAEEAEAAAREIRCA